MDNNKDTFQGNQQQQTLQMRRKHNRNASNSRDAGNSRAAIDKTSRVLAKMHEKNC
jgi:hypothetical protein